MASVKIKPVLEDSALEQLSTIAANEAGTSPDKSVADEDWRVLQHEVARYIGSMTAEMGKMARSAKFDLLVYFLDMAQIEANALAERTDD